MTSSEASAVTASLHVITDRDRRGAQVHAIDLASGLARRAARAEVVALAPGANDDLLPVEALGPRRRSPTTLRALRRRARDADVVVAHGSATLAACALALGGASTPFVYRQISDPLFWARTTNRRLRVAAAVHRASKVVVLSDALASTFARRYWLGADRLVTVPNAVPGEAWQPPTPDGRAAARRKLRVSGERVVVVYLGALVPEKGVDAAIRAIATMSNVEMLVVGDGSERGALAKLAQDLSAPVRFLGPTDEPRSVLHAADLLVLASRGGDSMPAVLIEAGLCAVPAVATPVGAIGEVIAEGATGRIVPIGDDQALASALRELTEDAALRRSMGATARSLYSSRYTIDAVSPTWESVLGSAVRKPAEAEAT